MRGSTGSQGGKRALIAATAPVAVPLILLLAHALMIAIAGSRAMHWSFGFLVAIPLITGIASLHRGLGATSGGWFALGGAMLCWTGGIAATMVGTLAPGIAQSESLSMLLYVLYGVPLIFALASPEDEDWKVRLVDGALALVLGYLFFSYVSRLTSSGTTLADFDALRLMFDIENGYIALFAIIRFAACGDRRHLAFFRALAAYAVTYLAAAAYTNHVQSETAFGLLPDLVIGLPFLLLLALVLAGGEGRPSPLAGRTIFTRLVRAASPLMIPATLLTTSALLLGFDPALAVSGSAAATLGYGLRTVLAQLHGFEERDRLERLSHADALTGVPNRRQFEEVLRREWARLSRDGGQIALLMIDIDHFKQLNDRYGHAEGDARLRDVARALTGAARRGTDLVARYGGEEFAAILPGVDADRAMTLATAMCHAVEALSLASPAGAGIVTVSIGVAHADHAAGEVRTLLERADAALYRSKASGRNCVTQAIAMVDQAASSLPLGSRFA